jgi:hypothetical protein
MTPLRLSLSLIEFAQANATYVSSPWLPWLAKMRACPSGLGQKRTAAVNVTADRNGLRRSMTLAAEKWTLNFRTPRNLIHNKQNHCGTCRQKSTHSARCFAPHIHYLPGMLQLCQMLPNATARPVKSLILSSQRGRSQVWVGLCSPFQQTYCKHPKHLESSEPRYKPTYLSGHAAQQKKPFGNQTWQLGIPICLVRLSFVQDDMTHMTHMRVGSQNSEVKNPMIYSHIPYP